MSFDLVATDGPTSFHLPEGLPLVVGRALTSDLPVDHATISRRHAELTALADAVRVRDLGSRNGTFVNGRSTSDGRAAAGDVLTFGSASFELRARPATAAEPAPARRPDAPATGHLPAATSAATGGVATIVRERRVPASAREAAQALRRTETHLAVMPAAIAPADPTPAAESRVRRRLELLLEVAKGLSRARDPDALLGDIVDHLYEVLEVDRVAIQLLDEAGGLVPRVSRDRRGASVEELVPRSIAHRAVAERVAILTDDAPEDARFGGASIIAQQVRSAICAPLAASDGAVLGVLYVDSRSLTHRYTEEDLDVLIAFAGIAGAALENSRLAERVRREALVRGNFERYFAPALAARIAAAPGEVRLGGERRPVAVLFADIRGFTPLVERMPPEEVAALLSEHLSQMADCVFRHGGTLDKFIGDAVMAQWGAPLAAPDDPDRALAAAQDMLRALDAMNAAWRARGRPALGIGIGLAWGEVFAGNIGSERRLEYTIIGDTVNVAAGVCAAAGPGEILVTEELRRALRDAPPLAECPPLELKGRTQPVRVHRLAW